MAEVLSQSQIDALLNSMANVDDGQSKDNLSSTGNAVAQDVMADEKATYRKYDFYSPKKFTTDKLKQLKGIYENFARITSSQLNAILGINTEFEVLTVEEQRYHEFANALSESDVMMLTDLELPDGSKNPPMLTHINQVLMVNIIERMLGGMGENTDIDAFYTYTDIELALYEKAMSYIMKPTKDAWSNYINVDISNMRLEVNPSLFQEIRFDEPVAIVMFKCTVQNTEGRMSICIPGTLLTSIFSIIDKRKSVEDFYNNVSGDEKASIVSKMKRTPLTVHADFGVSHLDVRDVCSLKVGDVIDLNKPKDSNIILYVEKRPWFEGKLGVYNN